MSLRISITAQGMLKGLSNKNNTVSSLEVLERNLRWNKTCGIIKD